MAEHDREAFQMNGANSCANSWWYPMSRFVTEFKQRLQRNKYFVLYLIAAALFLTIWHSRVTHRVSARAFVVFLALCVLSLIYGRLFIKLTSFRATRGFSIQFLSGYLVLSTLLFLLSLF